jgi:hypothetical protein
MEAMKDTDYLDDELVDSSEEEELKKEEEKEVSESTVTFTGAVGPAVKALIVCEDIHSQSLTKIIFDEQLVEVGKGETKYKEKTKDTLKFYYVQQYGFLIVHPQPGIKGSFVQDLLDETFGAVSKNNINIERIIVLDSLYKTNYSTTDTGYISQIEGETPIKYYKTSFSSKDQHLTYFLAKYQPAGVLNIITGYGAGIIVQAEIAGLPAVYLTAILDSHFVSSETLQGFAPILNGLL